MRESGGGIAREGEGKEGGPPNQGEGGATAELECCVRGDVILPSEVFAEPCISNTFSPLQFPAAPLCFCIFAS